MTTSAFSSSITVELLEALLSPDAIQRTQAEAFLRNLPVEQRAADLLRCLQQQQQQAMPKHLQQMAAVLLRRDILLLTDPSLLAPLTKALLELFLVASSVSSSATTTTTSTTTSTSPTTTALGDCLAEICAVLSLIAPADSVTTMQGILQAISSAVSVCVCKQQHDSVHTSSRRVMTCVPISRKRFLTLSASASSSSLYILCTGFSS